MIIHLPLNIWASDIANAPDCGAQITLFIDTNTSKTDKTVNSFMLVSVNDEHADGLETRYLGKANYWVDRISEKKIEQIFDK